MADLDNHNEHIENTQAPPDTEQTADPVVAAEPRTIPEHIQDMMAEEILDGRILAVLADLLERVTALEAFATAPKSKAGTSS